MSKRKSVNVKAFSAPATSAFDAENIEEEENLEDEEDNFEEEKEEEEEEEEGEEEEEEEEAEEENFKEKDTWMNIAEAHHASNMLEATHHQHPSSRRPGHKKESALFSRKCDYSKYYPRFSDTTTNSCFNTPTFNEANKNERGRLISNESSENTFTSGHSKPHMSVLLQNTFSQNSMSLPKDFENYSNTDIMHACCRTKLINRKHAVRTKEPKMMHKKSYKIPRYKFKCYPTGKNSNEVEKKIIKNKPALQNGRSLKLSLQSHRPQRHHTRVCNAVDFSQDNFRTNRNKKYIKSKPVTSQKSSKTKGSEASSPKPNDIVADNIDWYSRGLFPLTFLTLNSLYWIIYLSIKPSFNDDEFIYVN